MGKNNLKISIVTIVFNDRNHIENTLLNILNQTARNQIEYIVIDGASTDGTEKIIEKYKDEIDILVSESDNGIYDAMNKGLRNATGDYIIYMNCGDRFSELDTIETAISMIGENRPDIFYGHYREVDALGNKSSVIPCRSCSKIWYGPVASHQSTFYRTAFLKSHRISFDETYKIAADYKLTAETIKNAQSAQQLDLCVSDFEVSGVSSTNQNTGLKEANRVRREVLDWNELEISVLTYVLLTARFGKKYFRPIYNIIRNRI